MQTKRYGRSFLLFKEGLLNSEGRIAIICPNSNFLYWAKKMVFDILGKPKEIRGNFWAYDNRYIVFIVISDQARDEHKLRGLDAKIFECNGYLTDAYLGVVRS